MKKIFLLFTFCIAGLSAMAQDESKKVWYDNISFSGLVQAQFQVANEDGADAFAQGGAFDEGTSNRFNIRRGRIKLGYKYDFISSNLQINLSEKGVSVVEALINLQTKDKTVGLVSGVFFKPFGFMMRWSPVVRMQPEKARVLQEIMSSDIGLGAYATFKGKNETVLGRFKLDLGVLSQGEGIANDRNLKNFLGIITYDQPIDKYNKLAFEFTSYVGSVENIGGDNSYFYDEATKSYRESTKSIDVQNRRLYYNFGIRYDGETSWGETKLLTEYMFGEQAGYINTSQTALVRATAGTVYNRNFQGGYIYFQQEIADKELFFMTQFDYYDPNSKISSDEIGVGSGTGAADVAYTTLGVGLYYRILNNRLAVSAYYDFVWNEKCPNLAEFSGNRKDNVFTLRLQCVF